MKSQTHNIPAEVSDIVKTLENKGFEAYLVGGCVRDILLNNKPKDWDITTNAKPEDIVSLFPKTFYENDYGTVGVVNENTEDKTLKIIEITPYRVESGYTDKRRPDKVDWGNSIEEDLKRRDFTINAIALASTGKIVDPFKGQEDLDKKLIRSVGDPHERLSEDALRTLRAIRLAVELGFHVEHFTEIALKTHADLLKHVAKERVRDEFVKIILSNEPMRGIEHLKDLGVLKYISPELEEGVGIEQNKAHSFDVWTHMVKTLDHSAKKEFALETRLASLFHDIGKPRTRRFSRETNQYTFYGHDVVGEKMTRKIMENLKFSRETIEKVTKLVRWHMFFSDTEQITLSAVRRMVANVGKENIWDLMNVRICDRIGTGRPKESPYRLRKYRSMIEEALRDPISVSMLKIKGGDIMEITGEKAGPKIGLILNALMEEILEDPKKNTKEFHVKRVKELNEMDEKTLKKLAVIGKNKQNMAENKEVEKIRSKHGVK